MRIQSRFYPRRTNRSGVIYIAVLAISTLVMIMAMGALLASRSLSRASTLSNDSDEAAGYAFSAVELARYMITYDTYWRTDYSPGAWFTNKTIGKGTMSCTISTGDSTFTNMTEDITVLGTGVKGFATQKVKAVLHSTLAPYTCLGSAIFAAGPINQNNTTINAATAGMSSNSTNSASSSQVGVSVAAGSTITGSYYKQMVQTNQTALTLPSASPLFSSYLTNGTTINYSSLGGGGSINKTVLSPTVNPFGGGVNANGIYVINCGGGNVTISNCRIVGTLVLLNASTVTVTNSVNWVPALVDYPALLVQGSLVLTMTNTALLENTSDRVSYNPPSTPYPYPGGTSNNTFTDSFPSIISGLIGVAGNVTTSNSPNFGILIVGGSLSCSGTLSPNYDSTYFTNPPPGFYTNTLNADSNTYTRSVN